MHDSRNITYKQFMSMLHAVDQMNSRQTSSYDTQTM